MTFIRVMFNPGKATEGERWLYDLVDVLESAFPSTYTYGTWTDSSWFEPVCAECGVPFLADEYCFFEVDRRPGIESRVTWCLDCAYAHLSTTYPGKALEPPQSALTSVWRLA